jgi:hypothetical protein
MLSGEGDSTLGFPGQYHGTQHLDEHGSMEETLRHGSFTRQVDQTGIGNPEGATSTVQGDAAHGFVHLPIEDLQPEVILGLLLPLLVEEPLQALPSRLEAPRIFHAPALGCPIPGREARVARGQELEEGNSALGTLLGCFSPGQPIAAYVVAFFHLLCSLMAWPEYG